MSIEIRRGGIEDGRRAVQLQGVVESRSWKHAARFEEI